MYIRVTAAGGHDFGQADLRQAVAADRPRFNPKRLKIWRVIDLEGGAGRFRLTRSDSRAADISAGFGLITVKVATARLVKLDHCRVGQRWSRSVAMTAFRQPARRQRKQKRD